MPSYSRPTIFVPYHEFDTLVQRGTRGAQPLATMVEPGTLYCVTDEGNKIERSNGTNWQSYSGAGTGGGGGTGDVVGPDFATDGAIAIYDGTTGKLLRDDIVTVQDIVDFVGNVKGPASSVAQVLAAFADTTGKLITGSGLVVTDVARISAENIFSPKQNIQGANPELLLNDTSVAANQRSITLKNTAQALYIRTLNDDGTPVSTLAVFARTGAAAILGPLDVTNGLGSTPLNASNLTTGTVPAARLTAANLPAHASRHTAGGADPLQVSAASRLLGRGSAAGGGDVQEITLGTGLLMTGAILSTTGGGSGDVVGPASAVVDNVVLFAATSGKIIKDSAVAIANIARRDVNNVFVGTQTMTRSVPLLSFIDTDAPVDARHFRIADAAQQLLFQASNDAGTTVQSTPLVLNRVGDISVSRDTVTGRDFWEKGRGTPLGHWSDIPYSAANFGASGGGTWTVLPASVSAHSYTLVGKTLHLIAYLLTTTVAGTVQELQIMLPAGITAAHVHSTPFNYLDGANVSGVGWARTNLIDRISLFKDIVGTGWTAGTVHLLVSITISIV